VFDNSTSAERAIIKIRKTQSMRELIEFDVELSAVPVKYDGLGKDVTMNWRMYNGFFANKTFWTDSNSLSMIKRNFIKFPRADHYIPGNYYPVTSAIAMRDHSGSDVQVTVMNDRPQGGSADVSQPNTIELMQHRRTLGDDDKGVAEALNEMDPSGVGIAVSARYYMQIFNTKKGQSLQRSQ